MVSHLLRSSGIHCCSLSNGSEQLGLLLSYCKSEHVLVELVFFTAGLNYFFKKTIFVCVLQKLQKVAVQNRRFFVLGLVFFCFYGTAFS